MPSFSVRCVFLCAKRSDQTARHLYEERVTLWEAEDIDQAIAFAEEEAKRYAADQDQYLGLAQAYALYDQVAATGVEVFSLMRNSDLDAESYLSTFFATGKERSS